MIDPYKPPLAPLFAAEDKRSWLRFSLLKCWTGKERLWKAFWLLAAIFIGIKVCLIALFFAAQMQPQRAMASVLAITALLLVFWAISIWRCAWRCSHWTWAVLAKIFSMLLVLRAVAHLALLGSWVVPR